MDRRDIMQTLHGKNNKRDVTKKFSIGKCIGTFALIRGPCHNSKRSWHYSLYYALVFPGEKKIFNKFSIRFTDEFFFQKSQLKKLRVNKVSNKFLFLSQRKIFI